MNILHIILYKHRNFTQASVNTPFLSTGSFDYRKFYRGRLMTPKEQRFENFVNDIQARHDEISDLNEWRRRKDLEEEAILLYYELDEDMEEFSRQMKTRDQQETEFQCQRKNKKAKDLDPRHSLECLQAMELEGQRRLRAEEAEERVREQLRKSGDEESCRQFNDQVQSRLKVVCDNNRSVSSAGLGYSRQQVQETALSKQISRPQLDDQVRSLPMIPRNNNQTAPSAGVDPSRQYGRQITLSEQESRLQVHGQGQPAPARTTARPSARPTMAPFSRDSDGFDFDSPVSAEREDSFVVKLAGHQTRIGLCPVYLPNGSFLAGSMRPSLSGLPKRDLHEFGPSRSSAGVQNNTAANQGKPDGLQNHHDEQQQPSADPSSSVPSPQHISNEGERSTPASSRPSPTSPSPPEKPLKSNALLEPNSSSFSHNTNNNEDPNNSIAPFWQNIGGNNTPADRFECLDPLRRENPYLIGTYSDRSRARCEQEENRRRFRPDKAIWGEEIGF